MTGDATGSDEILLERDGAIRIVTLNRPDALNAVSESLHTRLAGLWDELASDVDASVVVLTGAGRAFSAGGDLDYIKRFADDEALRNRTMEEARSILFGMLRFPLPVIAAVNGPAVGLGMSLALASDIVLMSDRAYFADPHIAVGLACGDGGAALLPVLAPMMRAKELLFTGARISADDAVDIGVATRVVESEQLMTEALDLAARIAKQPQFALRQTKRAIQVGLEHAVAAGADAALQGELASMGTDEHRNAVAGMLQAQAARAAEKATQKDSNG